MAKIIILGLGSGGFAASLAIRRNDPEASVTIIEKRTYDMFSPCGMPFAIEGIVSLDDLKFSLPPDEHLTKLLEHEAQAINPAERNVVVKNLRTGEIVSIPYDSLIIALGAQPFIPPVKGAKESIGRGVFVLHDIESAQDIIENAKSSKRAIVVGAGPIGLEIAVALKEKGLDVFVVEMLSSALPRALDRDMAKVVERSLEERQIRLLLNKTVGSINGTPVESVSIDNEIIRTDMVILAAGVRANVDIAKNAGIEVGRWGIKTNASMETNIKGIYAVGDCIETVSLITHRPTTMQLASAAFRQGTVAGTNAAGGYDMYEGALSTYVSLIGKLEVASAGLSEYFAESAGFETISGKAQGKNKPAYYPGAKDIIIKVIADARTGRVLGGQAIGEGAAARINMISLAVRNGMDVYSLSQTETAYCPMLAESYDVLNKAADFAVRKLRKGR
ncbi:NAD(P)H-nitrite reductase [Candidatus Methanoperedens nitroreducens]|uniref:NAD(P)H-nitrite reductase n=1 Tax=Candidatus Methanoperedens nitratireducens TaxID=1392998 RepID=A0A062VBH1_9EURY|nr:FAD-dependent oxidoreductase [Candidatus Methanoperedens nitroreducens]KCZ72660.1 NAD(P)H-nitrite reductase [Candidatus Methanoperedens nitroreducens]MDJ1423408.1 FAD-dependent oxidoreductase [Candidatus Methanoperedens sp.]